MSDAASAVLVAAIEGLALTTEEERFFVEERPAGLTLFRRNIPQDDHLKLSVLCQKLQSMRSSNEAPLVIAVDQEGGRVSRFGPTFPNLGPPQYIEGGRSDSNALMTLQNYGSKVGQELLAVGVNVDFAPVLDILTNSINHAIGDRVFGVTADDVTARAGAFFLGLESSKVFGCLKHFPGQGDAGFDTHASGAKIDQSFQTLWQREIAPFRALMHKASLVMVSHCQYPVFCDFEASRSRAIIEDLLRGRLGFTGVVVSDDLNMGALPQQIQDWQAALLDSMAAGCDMLLVCRHLERAYAALDALRREAARSPAFSARLELAASRVSAFRRKI
jgi:beta-N-acetylhexosaminidase